MDHLEPEPEHQFTATELEAIGDYLPQVRRSLSDESIQRFYLATAFVVGLIVHVVAYLLKPGAGTGLTGLLDDLLYALGFALWTGVVLAFFMEVLPQAKRRQISEALAAYDALQREKASKLGSLPPV